MPSSLNEAFFPNTIMTRTTPPVSFPPGLSSLALELYWTALGDSGADLDIGLLTFNNKGHKLDEITFGNPASADLAITHQGDALGSSTGTDSETIHVDLPKISRRVFALVLVATASTGTLGDCGSMGARVLQRYEKGRGEVHTKEMIKVECDPREPMFKGSNASILLVLYRKSEFVDDTQPPAGWQILAPLTHLTSKNVDDCVPAGQRTLQTILPSIIVRGQELPIATVTDIIAFIQPVTLAFFRTNFPRTGYTADAFVKTMCKVLMSENPLLRAPNQSGRLVLLLYEMFHQIDVNGIAVVHWGEFTSFCVAAGMGVSGKDEKRCAPDVEYNYRPDEGFKHYGHKYSKIKVWEGINKVALIEERGSKVRIVSKKTGALDLVICIFSKKATPTDPVDPLNESSYTTVMDCIYFTSKGGHWICVAGSDYQITLWRYEPLKVTITFAYAISVEYVQTLLLFVPPTPHACSSLWSVGTDGMLSQWDLETRRRVHHAENAHDDHITSMIFVPSILMVATGSMDKKIKLWDFDTCRIRGKPLVTSEPVKALSCSSERMVSCGPCNIIVWEFQSMSELHVISLANPGMPTFVNASIVIFNDIVQGPQCRVLTGDAEGTFKIWAISENATAGGSLAGGDVAEVAQTFCAKPTLGTMMEFATSQSKSGCWPDVFCSGSGRETELFKAKRVEKPHVTMPFALHLHSSNSIVVVENKDLVVWDIMSGSEMFHVTDASPYEITFVTLDYPLQRKLYLGNSKGQIIVFNAFSCAQICAVDAHDSAVLSINFCECSRYVVSCALNGTVKVFEEGESDFKLLRVLGNSHEAGLTCFDYDPFMSLFATASGEDIKVWDFQDLQLQDHLDVHGTEVTAITFVRKMPLLVSADIQGRVLVWSVEQRAALSSASCQCLVSCVLDGSSAVHNVRQMKLLYDPDDKLKEGKPISLFCSDFTGLLCVWGFEDILEKLPGEHRHLIKASEFASADENYRANLRYEKNGKFAASKRNKSMFPETEVLSARHWQAHDESILAMETLQAAPMVVTTAADCKLRLWCATPCKMGLRECDYGTLFGEIDTMDYEERREERVERWNTPNVVNLGAMEEHSLIAKTIIEELEEEEEDDEGNRMTDALKGINPALLKMGMKEPLGLTPNASPVGRGRGGKGSVIASFDRRRSREPAAHSKKKLMSESQLMVSKRLKELKPATIAESRRASMKRVSMIINLDEDKDIEQELMDLFDDKEDFEAQQRQKKAHVRKIMDSMRQHMTSAYTSKTRTGKVIYKHLYTEAKSRDSSGGAVFTVTDFGMSDFVKLKLREEKARKKKLREAAAVKRMEQADGAVSRRRAASEEEEGERGYRKTEEVEGDWGEFDEEGGGDVRVENLNSFFMTERPETPKFEYDLGPGTELEDSTVGSLESDESLEGMGSVVTEAESIMRVQETTDEILNKIRTEDVLVALKKKRKERKKQNLLEGAAGGKRMTLMGRQTQLSRATVSKLTPERKLSLMGMKRQSIAMASHFGTYTRTEVLQLAELLYAMDFDGDGNISANEFEYYLKNGEYGDTFKHLQFEVMDLDKSGEITVEEVVALVFHKACKDDRRRIMVCIDDDIAKRTELLAKLANTGEKHRRITTVDMHSAEQMFDYFDVKGTGRINVKDLNKILLSDDKIKNVLNEMDVKQMLKEYGEREGGTGELIIDLDAFVNFSYEFKGGYEVVDPRNGKVVERHKLD